jgi:hypothetical protein
MWMDNVQSRLLPHYAHHAPTHSHCMEPIMSKAGTKHFHRHWAHVVKRVQSILPVPF